MDPKPNDELKADLELLLECLRCQEDNPTALKQALLTISSICATNNGSKDFFHECGGLQYVLNLMSSTQYLQVKESALYCLGCCIERNVFLQKKISTMSVFSCLYEMLTSHTSGTRLKQTAAYLVLCIVANNSYGQVMAMRSGCLQGLMHLFRSVISPESVMTTGEDLDPACLHFWSSVTSALCMCVNNPQNDDNQRLCATLLPYVFKLLDGCNLPKVVRPVASFLGLMVANNVHNQDRVRKCGGLAVLVSSIQRLHNKGRREPEFLDLAIHLVNTLDSCISDNVQNSDALGEGDVIDTLLLILSEADLDDQSQLQTILTLGHATDSSVKNQRKFMAAGGLPLLIQLMGGSTDEEFSKAIKYVLQACVKTAVKTDCSAEKNVPTTNQTPYTVAMESMLSGITSSGLPTQNHHLGLDNVILEKISQLSKKLDSMESSSEMALRKLNSTEKSTGELTGKTVDLNAKKFPTEESDNLTGLLGIDSMTGFTIPHIKMLMQNAFAKPSSNNVQVHRQAEESSHFDCHSEKSGHRSCQDAHSFPPDAPISHQDAPIFSHDASSVSGRAAWKYCSNCQNENVSKSCHTVPTYCKLCQNGHKCHCEDARMSCHHTQEPCQGGPRSCHDVPIRSCQDAKKSFQDESKSDEPAPSSPLITDTITAQKENIVLQKRRPRRGTLTNGQQKTLQQSTAQKKVVDVLQQDKKELLDKLKKEEERRVAVEREAESLREKVESQTQKEEAVAALTEEIERQLEDAVVSSSSQGSDQSEQQISPCSIKSVTVSNSQSTGGYVRMSSASKHHHSGSSHSKQLETISSVGNVLLKCTETNRDDTNPTGMTEHKAEAKSSSGSSHQNQSSSARKDPSTQLAGVISKSYSPSRRSVSHSVKEQYLPAYTDDDVQLHVEGRTAIAAADNRDDHLFVRPCHRPPHRRVGKENSSHPRSAGPTDAVPASASKHPWNSNTPQSASSYRSVSQGTLRQPWHGDTCNTSQSMSKTDSVAQFQQSSNTRQLCKSNTKCDGSGLQPVMVLEPRRHQKSLGYIGRSSTEINNSHGHLGQCVSMVSVTDRSRGNPNSADRLDESFLSDDQSEFDFHLMKKAQLSTHGCHLGSSSNISHPNFSSVAASAKCPWSVKVKRRILTSTPVNQPINPSFHTACYTEAWRRPPSQFVDRDLKVLCVKPQRPSKLRSLSAVLKEKEKRQNLYMPGKGDFEDFDSSSMCGWDTEEEDLMLPCGSSAHTERSPHSKPRISKCPGCQPAPNCSLPLLNSRTYNIAMETHPHTCPCHREIRKLERQFIQKKIKEKKKGFIRPSNAGRPLRSLENIHDIGARTFQQKGEDSDEGRLAVYNFSVSSSEGDDLHRKRVTPPDSQDLELVGKGAGRLREPFPWDKHAPLAQRKPRVPYSDEETTNLLMGVKTMGKHWNQILYTFAFHPSRTAVDLMEKYKRMMVSIKKSDKIGSQPAKSASGAPSRTEPFSLCEERRLKRGVQRFGYNWKLILESLMFSKGRTNEELRNKWRSLHRKDLTVPN